MLSTWTLRCDRCRIKQCIRIPGHASNPGKYFLSTLIKKGWKVTWEEENFFYIVNGSALCPACASLDPQPPPTVVHVSDP